MSELSLAYWNHDEIQVPIEPVLREACQKSDINFTLFKDVAGWLHKCRVGIFHGRPRVKREGALREVDYYEYLSESSVSSTDGLVLLFVSSVPITELPVKRIRFNQQSGEEGVRYLLPVPRTTECGLVPSPKGDFSKEHTIERWQHLLKAVLDRNILDAWFSNPGEDETFTILNDIFLDRSSLQLLPALLILCQGYLAVHAMYKGPDTLDWRPEDIKSALDEMGWNALISRTASRESMKPSDLSNQKQNVRKQSWWLQAFDVLDGSQEINPGRWKTFKDDLTREWIRGTNAGIPTELNTLLDMLGSKGIEITPPTVVADAYRAVAQNLAKR
jgi:lambda repressor-like predicted transcriptional regulator